MDPWTHAPAAAAGTARSGLSQDTRLFQLHTPLGPEALIGETLEAWEAVGPRPGPALGDDSPGWDDGPQPWALDASLGPARAGLRLVVQALSADAHLELKTLIGQPALVELLCQDRLDAPRPWHGHVVAAALLGADGGLARYRLVIEPWLSFLAQRSDAWVFQQRSVPEVLDEVFSRGLGPCPVAPAWRWALADAGVYARRSLCVQHHESDLDFVSRLMLEEGLFCWWEHQGEPDGAALGRHTLVIADHNGAFAPNPQPRVRFTGSGPTLGADSLTRWRTASAVAASRVSQLSRDYRCPGPRPAQAPVADTPTLPGLVLNDAPGPYAWEDADQGRRLCARQAQALGAARGLSHGCGPWRRAQAGTVFTLAEHPRHDGSDGARDTFVVLAAQHRTRNNLHAHDRARLPSLDEVLRTKAEEPRDEPPLHEAALLAQPLARPVRLGAVTLQAGHAGAREPAEAWGPLFEPAQASGLGLMRAQGTAPRPALEDPAADLLAAPAPLRSLPVPDVRQQRAPTAAGVQSALVTGDGTPVHTDRDARVRLQFHWQRGQGSSLRLPHPDGGSNAPANASSGTWVRVGQAHAGRNHGAVFIPRVGQEVLVGFVGGDVERPVVLGALYNGRGRPDAAGNQVLRGPAGAVGSAPPWFAGTARAGEHEGNQHPAVLMGHRSQSLDSSATGPSGGSQLVFDDSADEGRIELCASTAASRLQLGALRHQDGNQRLAPRGHGLDLQSDGHGALRTGAGLLLSAHAVPDSTGAGQQMDSRAPREVLRQAQERLHALAESAQAHGAKLQDEAAVAGATPQQADRQLPVERGLHALQQSLQATAGNAGGGWGDEAQRGGGLGTVAAWQRPELVMAAPAGIGLFTPASALFTTAVSATFVAGQDLNVMAQGQHLLAARRGVVLYTFGQAASREKPNTETGIAIHAAAGSVQASANTGAARLAARGDVEVASTQGSVEIGSPQSLLLAAAGAALKLDSGGIEVTAPGSVKFRAGMKELTGPATASFIAPHLPTQSSLPPHAVEITHAYHDEAAVQGARYVAEFSDGSQHSGATDGAGKVVFTNPPPGAIRVQFEPDARAYQVKAADENPGHKPQLNDADWENLSRLHDEDQA